MFSKLRSNRPSHAIVVAYLALFVALGGSSYAAITITGKNVKNSSLTGSDIKNDSVTGKDVKSLGTGDVTDHSLVAKDFKAGQLPAGAPGPKGEKGGTGETGPRGPSDAIVSFGGSGSFPVAGPGTSPAEIDLPAGAEIVFANVVFHNGSTTDPTKVNCGLVPGDASQADFTQALDVARSDLEQAPGAATQTLSLTGAIESDAAQTVRLDCYGSGASTGGPLSYEDADIGAIQVETLTG